MSGSEPKTSRRRTETQSFGTSRRESHDASEFYARFPAPLISNDETLAPAFTLPEPACLAKDSRNMGELPDNSIALVVTSPPYFVGKEYELALAYGSEHIPNTYIDYLTMLRDVFRECHRVLEPGGRMAVNVANLGRKPYRSLSSDVIQILQDDLQMLLRGEIIWQKAEGATGSVAWGSFKKATNPVLRDVSERIIIASKGRFNRSSSAKQRSADGLPSRSTTSTDEFMEATLDLWRIDSESARKVNHPAPFPVELPRRLIELYTYANDIVLDPFAGSGSTLVAAQRTGRRFVGYDRDPDYVKSTLDRLEAERSNPEPTAPYQIAARSGLKVLDIASDLLEGSGFKIEKEQPRIGRTPLNADFLVSNAQDVLYVVDVAGAFTAARPGLTRTETIWKTLARASIIAAQFPDALLLILSSRLPKPGGSNDKVIRAAGRATLFDVIEMFDEASMSRLTAYAAGEAGPLAGFWREADLEPRL